MSYMILRPRALKKSGPPTKKFKTEPVNVKGRLEWTVTRQALESAKVGDRITSPAFKIKLPGETSKWEFRLYPKGSPKLTAVNGSTVSLIVKCNKTDFPQKITLETSFIKNGENKEIPYSANSMFVDRHIRGSNGCRHIIQDLQELFVNDKITFVANVSFGDEGRRSEWYMPGNSVESHDQTLLTNMIKGPSSLGPLADFTVICEGKEYPCHKVILASRSDVFRAMVINETEEKKENKVEIMDSSADIVKAMLDYIYTAKIPANIEDINADLLYVAVKYILPGLIKACEVSLLDSISSSNCLDTLVTLDRHCPGSTSRKDAIKYVAENILKITDSEDWDMFPKEQPQLTTEIINCMAIKNKVQIEKAAGKV